MKRLIATLFIAGAFGFAFFRLAPVIREQHRMRFGQFEGTDRPERPPGQEFRGPRRFRGRPFGGPPEEAPVPGPEEVRSPVPQRLANPYHHLVARFDKTGDGWLNAEERKAARQFIETEKAEGRGPKHQSDFRRSKESAPEPGVKISPAEAKSYPESGLYEPAVLRTLFLEFDDPDWDRELADFYDTDVDVPARLTADGQTIPDVGVHFRGASSVSAVGTGRKYSLNLSTDFIKPDQNLQGYRTLNLLDGHTDPSYLRSVLYLQAARDYLPAPKANFVRVVINGESWGVYVNEQQFNKDFLRDWFSTTDGERWKVSGNARGRANLAYLGEDPTDYKEIYDIKSKDKNKSWRALIELCRVLNQTPPEQLEKELSPLLDIDGALKFLALENALINNDGYWIRAGEYDLYRDESQRFHIIPRDANETFREPEGPGGIELDPLQGADDPNRPLLHRLLAVPSLRAKYLGYVRDVAEKWLDWKKIGPIAEQYQALIREDVKNDPHKHYSFTAFTRALAEDTDEPGASGSEHTTSLKNFVERRQKFLLTRLASVKDSGKSE